MARSRSSPGAGAGSAPACALALAEAGADVVLASRTEEQLRAVAKEVEAFGRRAVVAPTDVNDDGATEALVALAVAELGGVDIVVNNAGGTDAPAAARHLRRLPRAGVPLQRHHRVRAHQGRRARRCSSAAAASIVNISSAMGRMADRGMLAYGTAKAALAHLTRLSAADLAPKIRVNAIAVGSVATSALEVVTADEGMRTQMEQATPLKRLGEVEDIAAACLWLASPAGGFVTGKVIEVDGGLQAPNLPLGMPDL